MFIVDMRCAGAAFRSASTNDERWSVLNVMKAQSNSDARFVPVAVLVPNSPGISSQSQGTRIRLPAAVAKRTNDFYPHQPDLPWMPVRGGDLVCPVFF